MVVEIKKQGIWVADGSEVGENFMPNSIEMQLGSANASKGIWRLAGSTTMSKQRVFISDSPVGQCYGFQNSGVQTVNDGSCYGIDSFPRQANTIYTISMWARTTNGVEAYAGYNLYNLTSYDKGSHSKVDKNYRVTTLPSTGEWVLCWLTYTTNSSTTGNIYIGITTGEEATITQMCGIKIEKGDKPTPWVPNINDSIYISSKIPFFESSNDNKLYIGNSWISANQFYQI